MVTLTLRQLLEQKTTYDQAYPGGPDTMPSRVYQAYQNLLVEIREAGQRAQSMLPGFDLAPVAPKGQTAMF